MAKAKVKKDKKKEAAAASVSKSILEEGTYEVIKKRLQAHGKKLRTSLEQLNDVRKSVFGSIDTTLVTTERVTSTHNCVPRDIVPVGSTFIFGFNVHMGLKTTTEIGDVFEVYERTEDGFMEASHDYFSDSIFQRDFQSLYQYFRDTRFAKFAIRGPHLFMVFRTGKAITDIKTFKWLIKDGGIKYLDNRSDHEYIFPPQHDYEWKRAHRDFHRYGVHPHISIEDRVFVETVGGDLTIKIEDNTDTGEGIYVEPVDNPDQTLDDAETFYAILDHLVLLKIRPYQEQNFRYFVYNGKIQKVDRIDAIEHTGILLPESHGLIFANGYYLQDGDKKIFENAPEEMVFERRVESPNGEDFFYIFYNRETGVYVLLSYNLISQKVTTPIICNGFSRFENGELLLFKAEDEPQKHHSIQIWNTPFVGANYVPEIQSDSYLYKLGNKTIVRCMSECYEILNLLNKEESYANLYVEITKRAGDILDSYFWLTKNDAFQINKPLGEIKKAAASAIEEFEKVVRIKRNTQSEVKRVSDRAQEIIREIDQSFVKDIHHFVKSLSQLRGVRGEIITLNTLRYVDVEPVEKLEANIVDHTNRLSQQCVTFLLDEASLLPYRKKVEEIRGRIDQAHTGADGRSLNEEVDVVSSELEMLIEVVSNLKIDDPTKTTAIIDRISTIYSEINQVKSSLKNRLHDLLKGESIAEFNAQIKLLNQSVTNYLEISDTPEKCEEYANKVMVQIEDLESTFSDFEEFILQLSETREELYNAFENKKVQLLEAQSRRAMAFAASADRILKVIQNRSNTLKTIPEINGYFASDMMIEKVRDIVAKLMDLGESVKADEIQTRLKTVQEDATRQLKDRQELYEDGDSIISIGRHKFTVNNQALELSVVNRDRELYFHLNGTGFFEKIVDADIEVTRAVWEQMVVSENEEVYRGEYLAYRLYLGLVESGDRQLQAWSKLSFEECLKYVQDFSAKRYAESYTKGVHDEDATRILLTLLDMDQSLGLLKYSAPARSLGLYYWLSNLDEDRKKTILANVEGHHRLKKIYPDVSAHPEVMQELQRWLEEFAEGFSDFDENDAADAADYLFQELGTIQRHVLSQSGSDLFRGFEEMLKQKKLVESYTRILDDVAVDPVARYRIVKNWVRAYIGDRGQPADLDVLDEVACLYLTGDLTDRHVVDVPRARDLEGMKGSHSVLEDGHYQFHFLKFMEKLRRYRNVVEPQYQLFSERKKGLMDSFAAQLRLDEFKPRILTSFVRNKLLNEVYLPLVGDNLAKQIGVAGESKRTDRMGLLMLISPPGYGKTTLMEYLANRLGLTFVKINGPTVGHQVTSIDPAEAGHAGARAELEKLNLAFEMGDNVMIYLDDIQHTNPEMLQKFISLCDAQRKIEGVYKGESKTYDLRGKKIVVVMAGNPYTESGEQFRIPDMLANRADTYNLGDIIGDSEDVFKLSYLENALTSNPVLLPLSRQSQADIYSMVRIAEQKSREGIDFEGNFDAEEINEYVNVLEKLIEVRDVVLQVNKQYIYSAGMEDAYREEPPFKLQGSYRNMNRIAERVLPVMNEAELQTLILSSYEGDAQTLTTAAEANLLKFKELTGWMSFEDQERWDSIRNSYKRSQLFAGVGEGDKMGLLMTQLGTLTTGLESIQSVLSTGFSLMGGPSEERPEAMSEMTEKTIVQVREILQELIQARDAKKVSKDVAAKMPDALAKVFDKQYETMRQWMEPMLKKTEQTSGHLQQLVEYFNEMVDGYNSVLSKLEDVYFPHPEDLKKKIEISEKTAKKK